MTFFDSCNDIYHHHIYRKMKKNLDGPYVTQNKLTISSILTRWQEWRNQMPLQHWNTRLCLHFGWSRLSSEMSDVICITMWQLRKVCLRCHRHNGLRGLSTFVSIRPNGVTSILTKWSVSGFNSDSRRLQAPSMCNEGHLQIPLNTSSYEQDTGLDGSTRSLEVYLQVLGLNLDCSNNNFC